MSFSAIPVFQLGDPAGEQSWAVAHYYEHLQFNSALGTLTATITNFPLQRLTKDQTWLAAHQHWHQAIWTALQAGTSADLATLDWEKPNQVDDWFQLHRSIHDDIRTALSL